MKLRNLLFALLAFSFFACEEVPPVLSGTTSQRTVFLEEFTGVRCVQCPAGSALIEDLLAANGVQLIAVSIHAGQFSPPYNDSQYDFRTEAGDEILDFLGSPFGYPSAVVNRKLFDGEFDLQLGDGQWAGFISSEKLEPPKVEIAMDSEFDETSRQATIDLTLFVQETISEEVNLSIMFTESGVEDLQKVPGQSEPKPDYVHKHVLRGMATNYLGDPISEAFTTGAQIEKSYTYTLPGEWVADNCKVIAFVSSTGANSEVLQAVEVGVTEP